MIEPDPLQQTDRVWVNHRGRKLLYFSGCDYFRMASHPRVLAAFHRGAKEFGLNVAASRLTTGNHAIYARLEAALAKFFGAPGALLAPTGYLADLLAAQALAGAFSHALLDEAAHPALQDAAGFLKARVRMFKSCDPKSLAQAARRCDPKSRILVLTDGMFARDGSVAPLAEYLEVLPATAHILVDDAHGAGVLGRTGKGTLEHAGVTRERIIQTITLSKAFGVYGGAILGSKALRQQALRHSRMFVGSTPLPPSFACAALASVALHASGNPMRKRLYENARYLKGILRAAGFDMPESPGPIVNFVPAGPAQAKKLRLALKAGGIFPPFLRYPGGAPEGQFRFVISSEHTRTHLNAAAAALLAAIGPSEMRELGFSHAEPVESRDRISPQRLDHVCDGCGKVHRASHRGKGLSRVRGRVYGI
jgi:7-keto-8-aminopelargonate synthetase-like enzyme